MDAEIAEKEVERQVQQHLGEISRSYWRLYMARGITGSKQLQASVIRHVLSAHELNVGLHVFAEAYPAGMSDENYNEARDDQPETASVQA